MKKFVWLIAFVSVLALSQALVPMGEAAIDDNASLTILKGEGVVNLNTTALGTGVIYTYTAVTPAGASDPTGQLLAGNTAIATQLNKTGDVRTIDLDTLATTLKLQSGVYSVIVTGKNGVQGLITYFLTPSSVTKFVP